jgi:hypothetical protein
MNIDDNHHKKQELAKSIWHIIKDKIQASYTDIEHNEIDKKAELLGLQKHEIIEIKNEQQNKLIAFIETQERKKREEELLEQEKIAKEQAEGERRRREEQEKIEKKKVELEKIRREEEEKIKAEEEELRIKQAQEKLKKQIKIGIGIFLIACLVGAGGFFIWKKNSNPYITTFSNTQTSSKTQEIPFQELMGEYVGTINGKGIKINILLEGQQTRYTYSENKSRSFRLTHFGKTNQINLFQPKEGLTEFTIFKEGNSIILRSANVELRKVK